MKILLLAVVISLSGCAVTQKEREAVNGELFDIWIETFREMSKSAGKAIGDRMAD